MTTIHSKPEGGRWDDPNTWVGGVVPTAADTVMGMHCTCDVCLTVALMRFWGWTMNDIEKRRP